MSNHTLILQNFQKHNDTYIYDDWQEVVVKFTREGEEIVCYVKQKGKEPYSIEWNTNLAMNTRLSGQIVDENFYKTF